MPVGDPVYPATTVINGNPQQLKNLEQAAAFIQWWNKQAPGAYEAFSKRIRG